MAARETQVSIREASPVSCAPNIARWTWWSWRCPDRAFVPNGRTRSRDPTIYDATPAIDDASAKRCLIATKAASICGTGAAEGSDGAGEQSCHKNRSHVSSMIRTPAEREPFLVRNAHRPQRLRR
jgi:hypothetical protein